MTVSLPHYAEVRGFPQRDAAEDFYLLNKLAQVGQIGLLEGEPITLVPRRSTRVPFGTGQGTAKLEALFKAGGTFTLYDPRSFEALKQLLEAFRRFSETRKVEDFEKEVFGDVAKLAIERLRIGHALCHAAERKDEKNCFRHIMTWFDGLKTLKFIHLMRDLGYPDVEEKCLSTFGKGKDPESR